METPLRSGSTRTFPRDPLGLLMRLLGCWCSCGWVLEILDVPNSWPCVIEHPKTSIATLQILREMWNLWICNPIWIDLRHSAVLNIATAWKVVILALAMCTGHRKHCSLNIFAIFDWETCSSRVFAKPNSSLRPEMMPWAVIEWCGWQKWLHRRRSPHILYVNEALTYKAVDSDVLLWPAC